MTGPSEPQYTSGYSALPASCGEVLTAAGDELRQFAGSLPTAGAQLVNTFKNDTWVGDTLNCTVIYEDPIPHPDKVSTPESLSRTVTINLLTVTTPAIAGQTTTTTAASPASTPVRGIGDQATLTALPLEKNQAQMRLDTKLDNLSLEIDTQGLNWSGASGAAPTGDSPELRKDLTSSAESIAKALIHHLSETLPRKTFRPDAATTTSAPTPATTTKPAPQPVWDPCTIPDADLAAAGLNPQSKKADSPDTHSGRCWWTSPSYHVDVFTWDSRFTDWAYEVHTQPRPVMVGNRRALLVNSDIPTDPGCILLFDIPQTTDIHGVRTGVVQIEARDDTASSRDAVCAELTRLAVPLSQHFPASR
ncbi:DUF3558 family protein [Nocardia macrotermitis]|uniref:DUF3558 family protein n=1 Tax=Nocardia macrotermitis TaxID=2585198 RepID=UPI00188642F1|nr:DUF3558 family protein [Nocardia macrotermitis]